MTPGQRGILALMRKHGIEITRENYIASNWPDNRPDPWTAEDEAELPESLQLTDADSGGVTEPMNAVQRKRDAERN